MQKLQLMCVQKKKPNRRVRRDFNFELSSNFPHALCLANVFSRNDRMKSELLHHPPPEPLCVYKHKSQENEKMYDESSHRKLYILKLPHRNNIQSLFFLRASHHLSPVFSTVRVVPCYPSFIFWNQSNID